MVLFFNDNDISREYDEIDSLGSFPIRLFDVLHDGDIAIYTYDSFYKIFKSPDGLISAGKIKDGCFDVFLKELYVEKEYKEQITKFEFINKN